MRHGVITRLVEDIELLTETAEVSPEELMGALSILILENLNSKKCNHIKINVSEQQLLIILQSAPPVSH